MKKLEIEFSNGDVFTVPDSIIIKNRAEWMSKIDNIPYQEALDDTKQLFNTHKEFKEWFELNMRWSDVEKYAEFQGNTNDGANWISYVGVIDYEN